MAHRLFHFNIRILVPGGTCSRRVFFFGFQMCKCPEPDSLCPTWDERSSREIFSWAVTFSQVKFDLKAYNRAYTLGCLERAWWWFVKSTITGFGNMSLFFKLFEVSVHHRSERMHGQFSWWFIQQLHHAQRLKRETDQNVRMNEWGYMHNSAS